MHQPTSTDNLLYFITTLVEQRRWFFTNRQRAQRLAETIDTCCAIKGFDLIAYAILPNHVHLLVRKLGRLESGRRLESRRPGDKELPEERFLFSRRRLSSRRRSGVHDYTLADLMQSIKGTYSRSLPPGRFWHRHSYVRRVDSDEYLANLLDYICHNYQKMELPTWYGQRPFADIRQLAINCLYLSDARRGVLR